MQAAGNIILAGPDGSFGPVVAQNSEVLVSSPAGSDVCYRGCAYSARNCSKAWSAQCCLWYVHYEEPLKSFDKRGV